MWVVTVACDRGANKGRVEILSVIEEVRVGGATSLRQIAAELNARGDLNAVIEVEKIHGDVLLISGDDDGVWSSQTMADAVIRRLKDAHFAYRSLHLSYAKAGHRVGKPEIEPVWTGGLTQGDGRALGGMEEL
jgi:hypothetical protein